MRCACIFHCSCISPTHLNTLYRDVWFIPAWCHTFPALSKGILTNHPTMGVQIHFNSEKMQCQCKLSTLLRDFTISLDSFTLIFTICITSWLVGIRTNLLNSVYCATYKKHWFPFSPKHYHWELFCHKIIIINSLFIIINMGFVSFFICLCMYCVYCLLHSTFI